MLHSKGSGYLCNFTHNKMVFREDFTCSFSVHTMIRFSNVCLTGIWVTAWVIQCFRLTRSQSVSLISRPCILSWWPWQHHTLLVDRMIDKLTDRKADRKLAYYSYRTSQPCHVHSDGEILCNSATTMVLLSLLYCEGYSKWGHWFNNQLRRPHTLPEVDYTQVPHVTTELWFIIEQFVPTCNTCISITSMLRS